jgi:hypothetical protein
MWQGKSTKSTTSVLLKVEEIQMKVTQEPNSRWGGNKGAHTRK